MSVRLKFGTWVITNNACCFSNFVTHTFKHSALYTQFRAGNPWQVMVIDHDSLTVIGVDIHGSNAKLRNSLKQ